MIPPVMIREVVTFLAGCVSDNLHAVPDIVAHRCIWILLPPMHLRLISYGRISTSW